MARKHVAGSTLVYLRNRYGMPFLRRGLLVNANGKVGRVTCFISTYVGVKHDDSKRTHRYHPKWNMTYFTKQGELIKDYKTV